MYGVTGGGGSAGGYGTIFEITTTDGLTMLHSFDLTDGSGPEGLVQASDGNLYGTTSAGGSADSGTILKITSTG